MESSTFLDGITLPAAPATPDPRSLYAALQGVTDRRKRRGRRYPLALVLTLLVLAKLAGEQKLSGVAHWVRLRTDWLVTVFQLPRACLPCANTYAWISNQVDLDELNAALAQVFVPPLPPLPAPPAAPLTPCRRGQRQLAVDGKTLCGTRCQGAQPRAAVHLLERYDGRYQAMLAQREVATKDQEVPCAAQLIADRDLRGWVLSADALHTQRAWCRQVIAQGGDYVLIAKRNQPGLLQDLALLFEGTWPSWLERCSTTTVEKGHGRIEVRHLHASTELNDYLGAQWAGLAQVFQIEREVTRDGHVTNEVVYGITSLPAEEAEPDRVLTVVRAHWHLENRVHWRKDVTLGEDASQVRTGQAPQVLAALNNAVLAVMDRLHVRNVPAKMREFAARPAAALALLMGPTDF